MKIYKFYADWCMPCKQLSKQIDNTDLKDIIQPINCDDDTEGLCEKYSIRNIPTVLITSDDGLELGRLVGAISINKIREKISECEEAEIKYFDEYKSKVLNNEIN